MSVTDNIDNGKYRPSGVEHDAVLGTYTSRNHVAMRTEQDQLVDIFWQDVATEYHAENYPPEQWKLMRDFAWENGHSNGFHAVLSCFLEAKVIADAAWID